jgi:hypothetical protein
MLFDRPKDTISMQRLVVLRALVYGVCCGGAAAVGGFSTILGAQTAAVVQPQLVYARYQPYPCASIAGRLSNVTRSERRLAWREWWPDTALTVSSADSLRNATARAQAIRDVSSCLATHTSTNVRARQQLGHALALLDAGRDAAADTAFRRVLRDRAAAPVLERAWLIGEIFGLYADGTSERWPLAMAYLEQLDALGPAAIGYRIGARNLLYQIFSSKDSVSAMVTQSQAALRLSQELKGEALEQWNGASLAAVLNKADLEARQKNFAGAIAVLKAAQSQFTAPSKRGIYDMLEREMGDKYIMLGRPAVPIQSSFVYLPGQLKPVSPSTLLSTGKPSLRIFVNYHSLDGSMTLYRTVQKVLARSRSKVDLILFAETSGWEADSLIPSPDIEATQIREFFHSYLNIAAPLSIWAQEVTGKTPDGRLIRAPNPNRTFMANLSVVDKAGVVRYVEQTRGGDEQGLPSEQRLLNMIDELSRE